MTINLSRCVLIGWFLISASIASAEVKTFTKEYTYQASELDSKSTSRINALEQVKRLLLEELGVFLTSQTEVVNSQLTRDQITSISAGIVSAVVLAESWDGRQYWLKAKVDADTTGVLLAIDNIRNDHKKSAELIAAKKQIDALNARLDAIRNDTANTISEKRIEYNRAANKIIAQDMMQEYNNNLGRGNVSAKEAVSVMNEILSLDPANSNAHYERADNYFKLKKYKEAERDYWKVIQIGQALKSVVYENLARIYYINKEYDKFIDSAYLAVINTDKLDSFYVPPKFFPGKLYDKLVRLYPKNYKVYLLRGHYYLKSANNKSLSNRVHQDLMRSVSMNAEQPSVYLLLIEYLASANTSDYDEYYNSIVKFCMLGLLYNPEINLKRELITRRAFDAGNTRGCELTFKDFEWLYTDDPRTGFYLGLMAKEKIKCGKYDEAILHYNKAIELYPDSSHIDDLFIELAGVYKINGQINLAKDAYTKALNITEKEIAKVKAVLDHPSKYSTVSVYEISYEYATKKRDKLNKSLNELN